MTIPKLSTETCSIFSVYKNKNSYKISLLQICYGPLIWQKKIKFRDWVLEGIQTPSSLSKLRWLKCPPLSIFYTCCRCVVRANEPGQHSYTLSFPTLVHPCLWESKSNLPNMDSAIPCPLRVLLWPFPSTAPLFMLMTPGRPYWLYTVLAGLVSNATVVTLICWNKLVLLSL